MRNGTDVREGIRTKWLGLGVGANLVIRQVDQVRGLDALAVKTHPK